MTERATSPLISVVVPTKNSSRTLDACLTSIRRQTYERVELLVVDDRSTDQTRSIAASLADSVLVAGPERSAQRNAGARRARGEYLLFIDSDMTLEPRVITECVDAATGGANAVIIPEASFGEGYWASCKALERSCYVGDETIEAARFFSRELFDALGGFDDQLTGEEDWDLHARARMAGAKIGRTSAMIHHDEGRLQLTGLVQKKFYYGGTLLRYVRLHPDVARTQRRLVRPAFVRHWRRLVGQPQLLAGLIVMKVCELGAGGAGMLVSVARRRT